MIMIFLFFETITKREKILLSANLLSRRLQLHELGISSRSPKWVVGAQAWEPSFTAFPEREQWSGSEVEQPRHKMALLWDSGIAGRYLTLYPQGWPLLSDFFKVHQRKAEDMTKHQDEIKSPSVKCGKPCLTLRSERWHEQSPVCQSLHY